MAFASKIRILTNQILPFIWHKNDISDTPFESALPHSKFLTKKLVEMLQKLVWTRMYVTALEWEVFLQKHSHRLFSSPKMFAKYSVFGCYTANEIEHDAYEHLVQDFALVAYFAVFASKQGQTGFIRMVPDILVSFLDKELSLSFQARGGWKNFGKYIVGHKYFASHGPIEFLLGEGSTQAKIVKVFNLGYSGILPGRETLLQDIQQDDVETHEGASILSQHFESFQLPSTDISVRPKTRTSTKKKPKKRSGRRKSSMSEDPEPELSYSPPKPSLKFKVCGSVDFPAPVLSTEPVSEFISDHQKLETKPGTDEFEYYQRYENAAFNLEKAMVQIEDEITHLEHMIRLAFQSLQFKINLART